MTTYDEATDQVAAHLLDAMRSGVDVGEFLLEAIYRAELTLVDQGLSLSDNRPGSWESSLLQGFINQAVARMEYERT